MEKLKILKTVLGPYTIDGKEYLFKCPKCTHHKNKLSINVDKSVWKCWICDFSGRKLRKIVKAYGRKPELIRWDAIEQETDETKSIKELLFKTEVEEEKIDITLPSEYTFALNGKDKDSKRVKEYLYSRGLTDLDILRWKIGYCSGGTYNGRIIIPSFNDKGKVTFFISRTFINTSRKYKNPAIDKSTIIFNELNIDWDKPIVLVEGVFDAIKAENAVPILGSSLKMTSKLFQRIVLSDVPVFVALDFDADKKAYDIIAILLKYDVEVYKLDTSKIEDIGAISKSEFKELYTQAKKIDSNQMLKNKIMAA